ncbi:MAG TPA: hypothetical protein VNA24_02355 [Hyalangium sp.]|nr:hypothetical protein [Hyalangium sp.]
MKSMEISAPGLQADERAARRGAALRGPEFRSFQDALLAACNKIITKPNAVAGRPGSQNFETYWRVASEYCAWIYYTPDEKYEMSKLTDQSEIDPTNRSRTCSLPPDVDDRRYSPGSLKYICAMHNHLFDDPLSEQDVQFIIKQVRRHGFESVTKDGMARLSAVAFFSNDRGAPACDGFHQYVPATSQMLKWTHTREGWNCEQTGRVVWADDGVRFSIVPKRGPCPRGAER